MYFEYGERETEYLKSKDKKLASVIDLIGHVYRAVDDDLFSSVVHHIIGQQISTKAQQTVWNRMSEAFGAVTPQAVGSADREVLRSFGMSFRKADYVKDFAKKVLDGEFDPDAVMQMPDEDAVAALVSLKGVGVWTAEMILLFCMRRPDMLSFGDLGIQRGMRMVYRHRVITAERFEKYRRRLSPYGSVASLYFWAVSGGALPELTDPGKSVTKKTAKNSPAKGREKGAPEGAES